MNYRFRRGAFETVNTETQKLEKWYTFKLTHPVELRGCYGSVDGTWKWATAAERDAALNQMKRIAAQPASDGGEYRCPHCGSDNPGTEPECPECGR